MAKKLCEVCSDEDDPETFDLEDNEQVRKELTDTVTAQPGKLTGLHACHRHSCGPLLQEVCLMTPGAR